MNRQPCSPNERPQTDAGETRRGVGYGVAAYLLWGLFPLFFKQLAHVAPLEVLSHRIVWSMLTLIIFVSASSGWSRVATALTDRRTLLILSVTTLLIATNWFIFITAVDQGQILQSSLGYFINPLVSVLLGFLFLKERLRRNQVISLVLACSGVIIITVHHGTLPWIALVLAITFGLYGLLRKIVAVDALPGLFTETLLLFPLALGYLLFRAAVGGGMFLHDSLQTSLLLFSAGVITAIPLLWFAASTRRLRLATVGFMQYITPTMHFLLAVLAYKEPFDPTHLAAFVCIWTGLAIYSYDAARGLFDRSRSNP
ncbi:MAG TPA: EamA family transporter RarD [Desulfuromonadaceae bacterium]|jgi:chloramphenicol-sensitive protein RarD